MVDSRGVRCTTNAESGTRIRAARRWPPKRCRMIASRRPDAIPVGRPHPRHGVSEFSPAATSGSRAPGAPPVEPRPRAGRSEPCEVDPPAWNIRSERPVSRTSIDSSRSASGSTVSRADSPPWCRATSCASSSTCPRPASSSPRHSVVVVGGAVLALRPSVRAGGYVGTIDLLVVDPNTTPTASPRRSSRSCSDRPATRAVPSSRRHSRTIPASTSTLAPAWASSTTVRPLNESVIAAGLPRVACDKRPSRAA